jgi:hypothetical protein
MPGLNRKGPNGDGAMTGRRMGRCNPENKGKTDAEILQNRNNSDQSQEKQFGQRRGRGNGGGKGLGLGRGMCLHNRGTA